LLCFRIYNCIIYCGYAVNIDECGYYKLKIHKRLKPAAHESSSLLARRIPYLLSEHEELLAPREANSPPPLRNTKSSSLSAFYKRDLYDLAWELAQLRALVCGGAKSWGNI
jgi:hypothetical protein